MRESAQDNSRLSSCVALANANKQASTPQAIATRRKAIEQVSARLKRNEPAMLRARADAARKGLYGFKQDPDTALRLYERAKIPDAGLNAALILFKAARDPMDPETGKRIIDVLNRSGAALPNSRGSTGSQAHYMAGLVHESGAAGSAEPKKAFEHYRASARNGYVPGAFHYLRLLSQTLEKLPESERSVVLQEMRMMMNRWRWQSADIMLLNGDMYAGKWIPDDEGFLAQYHWRMAQRMGGPKEVRDFDDALKTRLKKLSPEKEKRLDEAVESGIRNVMPVKHELEFADLCAE
ncbi:hypothetical protein KW835_13525 [Acidovorax sp. sic0104]|nr:hypothetical protein [Acidovorax sp. sic0104]